VSGGMLFITSSTFVSVIDVRVQPVRKTERQTYHTQLAVTVPIHEHKFKVKNYCKFVIQTHY
jgi:hypothetical protein